VLTCPEWAARVCVCVCVSDRLRKRHARHITAPQKGTPLPGCTAKPNWALPPSGLWLSPTLSMTSTNISDFCLWGLVPSIQITHAHLNKKCDRDLIKHCLFLHENACWDVQMTVLMSAVWGGGEPSSTTCPCAHSHTRARTRRWCRGEGMCCWMKQPVLTRGCAVPRQADSAPQSAVTVVFFSHIQTDYRRSLCWVTATLPTGPPRGVLLVSFGSTSKGVVYTFLF